ncbi:MAG: hypothetical protein IKL65_00240 [Bacilli bacterium]|nr:hypothetical protein [Bacilli bacterium]
MNESNLIPNSERTPKERQEIARKGGIASGKARRERKAFKEALLLALDTELENGKTVQDVGIDALILKYIDGDLDVFKAIRDTIGEKPTDKIEADVNSEVNINIELTDD